MKRSVIEPLKVGVLQRSIKLDRANLDEASRTVRVQFSSEAPVERWFGQEILDHSPTSVRMERLRDGVAVLLEHSVNQRIGITDSATITGNRTGEAVVRFSKTPRGDEAMVEVKDGTLKYLSVGYRVHKYQAEGEVEDEDDEITYRATDWEPLEVTFTAIPADPSARVLARSEETALVAVPVEDKRTDKRTMNTPKVLLDQDAGDRGTGGGGGQSPNGATAAQAPPETRNVDEEMKLEKLRMKEILALGKRFNLEKEAETAIDSGTSIGDFRGLVLSKQNPGATITAEPPANETRSIGQFVVECDAYKRAMPGTQGDRPKPCSITIPHFSAFHSRATVTGTAGAVLTGYERPPGIVLLEQQPLTIADLLMSGTTTQPTIRFAKENTYTNAAAAVAEEGAKPEATFDIVESDEAVRKIAVSAKVTDETFADFPQMQAYIDQRLRFMVASKEDNELLNGTAASNRIRGLLNVSGIQTQASAGAATPHDAIFKAMGKVRRIGFFEPTFIILNPIDWENFALTKDSNGQYYGGGPFMGQYGNGGFSNVRIMWGVPAVATTAIAQGTALVGARLGAQIFRRQGITLEMTNSDQDDFVKNRVTLRCEERLALVTYRPLAFCTVTGIPLV